MLFSVSGYLSQLYLASSPRGGFYMGVQASAITIPFSVVKLTKAFFILQVISKSKLSRRLSRR